MRLEPKNPQFFTRQHGISMAFLLFIMIIIALLAAGLFKLNSSSSLSTAHQVIATRALMAAESGAELQAMQIFPLVGGGSVCSASETFTFNTSGLNGCQAVTSCTSFNIGPDTFYEVSSRGECNLGTPLQAARTIKLRLKDL